MCLLTVNDMRFLCVLCVCLIIMNPVWAHEPGITDTSIKIGASSVKIIYTLPNTYLDDIKNNGALEQGFELKNNNVLCSLVDFKQTSLNEIESTQFYYLISCSETLGDIAINYQLFEQSPDHQNIVRLSILGRHQYFTYTPAYRTHLVPVSKLVSSWRVNKIADKDTINGGILDALEEVKLGYSYFPLGFFHILEGYDHILFLLGLLFLPLTFRNLLTVSITFTIAHSITLGLSVIQDITIPAYIIESAIAFSIVYVGVENLWQLRRKNRDAMKFSYHKLAMIFIFGLIHGFGFSYLLKEVGFGEALLPALLFFNLGVELGQVVIILAALPILMLLEKQHLRLKASKLGSIFIILLGSLWLVERLG